MYVTSDNLREGIAKMATERQIEANQANGRKSTGPKTTEGKATASLNATKHGLSGATMDAPGLENLAGEVLDGMREAFHNEFCPMTLEQIRLVETMAVEAVRIDRAREASFVLMGQVAHRAKMFWENDRIRDAEVVYSKLKKDPSRWSAELETTKAGCLVAIDRWTSLKACLIKHKAWTDDQRTMALNLLGEPFETRQGVTRIDPVNADNLFQVRLRVCNKELSRLKSLFEDFVPLDNYEREQHESGVYFLFNKEARLFDRYENAADARYEAARKRLLELGCRIHHTKPKQASTSDDLAIVDDIAPEPAPAPEPSRPAVVEVVRDEELIEAIASKLYGGNKPYAPVDLSLISSPHKLLAKAGQGLNRQQRKALEAQERRAK